VTSPTCCFKNTYGGTKNRWRTFSDGLQTKLLFSRFYESEHNSDLNALKTSWASSKLSQTLKMMCSQIQKFGCLETIPLKLQVWNVPIFDLKWYWFRKHLQLLLLYNTARYKKFLLQKWKNLHFAVKNRKFSNTTVVLSNFKE